MYNVTDYLSFISHGQLSHFNKNICLMKLSDTNKILNGI